MRMRRNGCNRTARPLFSYNAANPYPRIAMNLITNGWSSRFQEISLNLEICYRTRLSGFPSVPHSAIKIICTVCNDFTFHICFIVQTATVVVLKSNLYIYTSFSDKLNNKNQHFIAHRAKLFQYACKRTLVSLGDRFRTTLAVKIITHPKIIYPYTNVIHFLEESTLREFRLCLTNEDNQKYENYKHKVLMQRCKE